jgi:hypothetical protein
MLVNRMVTLVILAVAFFITMSLMRWTLRKSSRAARADGIRWRGIDWSGVKKEETAPAEEEPPKQET